MPRSVTHAEIALTTLLAVVLAAAVVDDRYLPRRVTLDLAEPASFLVEPDRARPSQIGHFKWAGAGPLEIDAEPIRAGDVFRLKLRADATTEPVELTLDGRPLTTLAVDDRWQQLEVVAPHDARRLALRAASGGAVHVSRITWTDLRASWQEGPLRVYVAHGEPPALLARLLPALPSALAALTGLALVALARARRLGRPLLGALRPVLVAAAPLTLLLLAGAALPVAGPLRLVVSSAAFVLLVVTGPSALELACRLRTLPRLLLSTWRAAATAPPPADYEQPRPVGAMAWLVVALLAVALTAVVFHVVVFTLDGFLFANGDVNQWLLQNRYVADHLRWLPLPHLELDNDHLFYPYGGCNVFQPWVLEMHLAGAVADAVLGPGPWVRLYFLASLLMTALGAFALLGREHGPWRGGLAALAVAFAGYYGLAKYPGHLGVGIAHWTVLGLLADHLLARRVAAGRVPSARLLLVRALLLVLALGQDLGYVAGLSLTSFVVTVAWAVVVVAARGGLRRSALEPRCRAVVAALGDSARRHPWQTSILLGATLATGLVLVPVVAHIALAARRFDFSSMTDAGWWADPRRLLTPLLPGLDQTAFFARFADNPEGLFAATPGLAFVLAAAAGLVAGRRRLGAAVPAVLTLLLLLSFHPLHVPLLKVLPWFGFARVTGRFTVAYPALLAVLALSAPRATARSWWARATTAALVALLLVEATTVYRLVAHPRRYFHPPADFARLTEAIRTAPGEAVFEWPFCLAGGNGVGTGQLGVYYATQVGAAGMQVFHGKKLVGSYFGRLHPDQLRPYVAAGWPALFVPADREVHHRTRQRRDFLPHEWDFVTRFVARNDFAGVLLYPELLVPETVAGFHQRFGPPAAVADSPFGRLEFIVKPVAWQALEDPAAGRQLVFAARAPILVPGQRLLLGTVIGDEYVGPGWGSGEDRFRATVAKRAVLEFSTPVRDGLVLRCDGQTFQRQRVDFVLNGQLLATVTFTGDDWEVVEVPLATTAMAVENELVLLLPDAHSPRSIGVNLDARELGLTVRWLELGEAH